MRLFRGGSVAQVGLGMMVSLSFVSASASGAQVNFETLSIGQTFGSPNNSAGQVVFSQESIDVSVETFQTGTFQDLNLATINGPGTDLFATKHVFFDNINFGFDLTDVAPINNVTIEYHEFGGVNNFSVNGGPILELPAMTSMPANVAPGVTATVDADSIHLSGPISSFLIGGQELDLRRFAGANQQAIVSLQSETELDDYTYRVAGCVGEFWTKMCRAHLFPEAKLDDARFLDDAVRFGKGLQLVNILRDLPVDLQQGRCYLPQSELKHLGLSPADLLIPANEPKLRPLYNSLLDLAQAHLTAGWRYTSTIPRSQMRVRWACAWPILIGVATLGRLRRGPVLDPQLRVKVSRAEVKRIMLGSLLKYPFASAWERQFAEGASAGKAVA